MEGQGNGRDEEENLWMKKKGSEREGKHYPPRKAKGKAKGRNEQEGKKGINEGVRIF